MNHGTHLSNLRLDQLLAGELDPPAEAALRAHLVACIPCTRRHGALIADVAQVRDDPRFAALAPIVRTRIAGGEHQTRPYARRRSWAAAAIAVCAVAAAAFAIMRRPDADIDARGVSLVGSRIKGDLAMDVFVRRAGSAANVEALLAEDSVHPGDRLRVRVRAAARGHFGVFAVDAPPPPAPAPAVAAYLPAGAELAAVDAGVPLLLDGAVELDGSLGREQLLGVLCPSPRNKEAVAAQLRAALAAAGGDPGHLDWRRAAPGCVVSAFWLRKVAAP